MKNPPDRISLLIQQAWDAKVDKDLGTFRDLVSQILRQKKLEPYTLTESWLSQIPLEEFPTACEIILLLASLARSDDQMDRCRGLIAMVDRVVNQRGWVPFFSLLFQKGFVAFYLGDFTQALDLFLSAREASPRIKDKICALSNVLYCLENLGLPYEQTLEELSELFKQVSPLELPDARALLEACQLRMWFRKGDLKSIFGDRLNFDRVTQAIYFRFWISELPYHKYSGHFSEKESYLLKNPNFFQRSYRLRTLQGIFTEEDLLQYRLSDLSDRVYVWTWRWLLEPARLPLSHLVKTLELLPLASGATKLTEEDCQLIRNVFQWLSLFHPLQAGRYRRLAQRVCPKPRLTFPLLELESHFTQWLMALQTGEGEKEAYRKLALHPLYKVPELYFEKLTRLVRGESIKAPANLKQLAERLRAKCIPSFSNSKAKLFIDMESFALFTRGSKDKFLSQPICLALDLMSRKPCIDFKEFVYVCFGLGRFDSFVHNAKVYNLIARLKNLLPPEIEVRTKGGRIYVTGSWSSVEFHRSGPEESVPYFGDETPLEEAMENFEPVSERETLVPPPKLVVRNEEGLLTRRDLELMTGKSRATANRIIAEWILEGSVQRVGKAKNTKYKVQSKPKTEIF